MRKILIYGDSNSFGTAPLDGPGQDAVHPRGTRWGDVMGRALGEDWEVIIEGLPGRTAVLDDPIEGAFRNGLTVMPAVLHSHKPIDLLLICLGTNDQKCRFGLRAQDIALGIGRLVREAMLTATVSRVMVICPPMVRERGGFVDMFAGAEVRCAELPAQLAWAVGREGAEFFDAGLVIEVDAKDGIHWNAASHAVLGQALAEAVQTLS